jgi:hypothetical protein
MPWEYNQTTGELRLVASSVDGGTPAAVDGGTPAAANGGTNGQLVGTGYSGRGTTFQQGRNNPSMQGVVDTGPIPTGRYNIGTAFNDVGGTGPNSLPLTPVDHNALGRTGFRIHGNNSANDASHGCVIMGPTIRQQIINSGDPVLIVVSGTNGDGGTPAPVDGGTPAAADGGT